MSRARWATGVLLAALLGAGLVQAQSAPPAQDPTAALNRAPQSPPPAERPADPIGDALEGRPEAPAQEEAPPAPGEVPAILPPAPPELTVEAEETAEEEAEAETAPTLTQPAEAADPLPRPRHRVAVLQALDKITAETIRFEVPVGRPVRWKGLVFTVRACETTAPDEPMRDAMAYVEVRSQPRMEDRRPTSRRVFQGWMFASSPGLSAMEHPVYDAWVIACQAAAPEAS